MHDGHISVRISVSLYPSKKYKLFAHRCEAKLPSSAPVIDQTVHGGFVGLIMYTLCLYR